MENSNEQQQIEQPNQQLQEQQQSQENSTQPQIVVDDLGTEFYSSNCPTVENSNQQQQIEQSNQQLEVQQQSPKNSTQSQIVVDNVGTQFIEEQADVTLSDGSVVSVVVYNKKITEQQGNNTTASTVSTAASTVTSTAASSSENPPVPPLVRAKPAVKRRLNVRRNPPTNTPSPNFSILPPPSVSSANKFLVPQQPPVRPRQRKTKTLRQPAQPMSQQEQQVGLMTTPQTNFTILPPPSISSMNKFLVPQQPPVKPRQRKPKIIEQPPNEPAGSPMLNPAQPMPQQEQQVTLTPQPNFTILPGPSTSSANQFLEPQQPPVKPRQRQTKILCQPPNQPARFIMLNPMPQQEQQVRLMNTPHPNFTILPGPSTTSTNQLLEPQQPPVGPRQGQPMIPDQPPNQPVSFVVLNSAQPIPQPHPNFTILPEPSTSSTNQFLEPQQSPVRLCQGQPMVLHQPPNQPVRFVVLNPAQPIPQPHPNFTILPGPSTSTTHQFLEPQQPPVRSRQRQSKLLGQPPNQPVRFIMLHPSQPKAEQEQQVRLLNTLLGPSRSINQFLKPQQPPVRPRQRQSKIIRQPPNHPARSAVLNPAQPMPQQEQQVELTYTPHPNFTLPGPSNSSTDQFLEPLQPPVRPRQRQSNILLQAPNQPAGSAVLNRAQSTFSQEQQPERKQRQKKRRQQQPRASVFMLKQPQPRNLQLQMRNLHEQKKRLRQQPPVRSRQQRPRKNRKQQPPNVPIRYLMMNEAQLQEEQFQIQQAKQSQLNYVIRRPIPNQRVQQQRPLPPFISAKDVQTLIESVPITEEDSLNCVRIMVVLQRGEQRLITFTMPNEDEICTIREFLEHVDIPFGNNTNVQVTEINTNGINYIVILEDDFDDYSTTVPQEALLNVPHASSVTLPHPIVQPLQPEPEPLPVPPLHPLAPVQQPPPQPEPATPGPSQGKPNQPPSEPPKQESDWLPLCTKFVRRCM